MEITDYLLFVVAAAALAAGILSTLSARRVLTLASGISKRMETAERRLQLMQLQVLGEGMLAESFHIDQLAGLLKTGMVENAIAEGTHTSAQFSQQVEKIDRYTQGVQGMRREAMSLCERVNSAPGLANGLEDLDKRLVNAGKRLAKLRETRRYFERRLQAHREGEQFFGDDTIQ